MTEDEKPKEKQNRFFSFIQDSVSDWLSWGNKLKWSFISFKFLSFFGFCGLLVLLWFGLERTFQKTIDMATNLHTSGHITQDHLTEIINTAQTVYYDNVIGHVSILAAAVLVAIIGLKMISEKVESEMAKVGKTKKDLKKFLKK